MAFTREDGSALHPDYVSRHFERLVRGAGLPPVRLHDLRHGAATLAIAAGADIKTVSELLGHASVSLTGDTYTSVAPSSRLPSGSVTLEFRDGRHKVRSQG